MIWLMRYSCWQRNLILDEEELHVFKRKIEDAKTFLSHQHKDKDWMDGFNAGLDWALRILNKDKSAF